MPLGLYSSAGGKLLPFEGANSPSRRKLVGQPINGSIDFQADILESLQQGILVLSQDLKLLYQNHRAALLCQKLSLLEQDDAFLPKVLTDACTHFLQSESFEQSMVVDCSKDSDCPIRMHVKYLQSSSGNERTARAPYLLVRLEDCHEALRQEMRLVKQRYALTNREADIWLLLQLQYTYQQIAQHLQISLNTVKTHAKNLYAKQRTDGTSQSVWYSG